jgi:poly-gamma-glutamate capsule biosynthesis protein CapA/YwtB (metallophosphatase superfamily)
MIRGAPSRVGPLRRVALFAAAVLAAGGLAACTAAADVHWVPPGSAPTGPGGAPLSTGPAAPDTTFTLSAVGDTIMAAAPNFLPPGGGAGFFDDVEGALHSDLQMANLEEPLTDYPHTGKCSAASLGRTCFAFRAPTAYAQQLKAAGFGLVNIANNHALDYGPQGHSDTENSLDAAGVAYTGPPGKITVVTVKGIRVAVLGFAPYDWANDLRDIPAGQALVRRARQQADIVLIQVHMGGEGANYQHVMPGTETFLGENRGDPIAFSHAMIDAGADMIIGHSPHVLRAMEFYKGHLIVYSLGNFAGYHALSTGYPMGVSMVLRATLRADGTLVSAKIVPTSMVSPGVPRMDPAGRAIGLVRSLTESDFPQTGAVIANDGSITPPAG